MNNLKSSSFLLISCLLSGSLAVASEGPSTPRKKKRPCPTLVMTPSPKRSRVAPMAPSKSRVPRASEGQEEGTPMASLIAMISGGTERVGRALGSEFEGLRDIGSELFTCAGSSRPVMGRLFRSNWETLSEDQKRHVVAGNSVDKDTLLHLLTRNKQFELADMVSQVPQDLLRQDKFGKVAADYYPNSRLSSSLLQSTAQQYYHNHWKQAERGLK